MVDEAHRTLVESATRGDRLAVDALTARHLQGLRRYLRLHTPAHLLQHESLSDLAQSVCREVLGEQDDSPFRSEGDFRLRLFRKARDKIVDRHRYRYAAARDPGREQHLNDMDGAAAAAGTAPSQRAVREEELEQFERAFAELGEDDRQVITLARIVGLSRAEIGAEMGRSEGAVRVLLHRALARLGAAMQQA